MARRDGAPGTRPRRNRSGPPIVAAQVWPHDGDRRLLRQAHGTLRSASVHRRDAQRAMTHPLAGLRVLDMSRVLAGPFAGRMLADLGADVVKVEPPEGDVTRLWGRSINGVAGYFNAQNVGKRDV